MSLASTVNFHLLFVLAILAAVYSAPASNQKTGSSDPQQVAAAKSGKSKKPSVDSVYHETSASVSPFDMESFSEVERTSAEEYNPLNFYTVSLKPKMQTALTEQITLLLDNNRTYGYIAFNCLTPDFAVCKTEMQVLDPMDRLIFKSKLTDDGSYKLTFFARGQYTFIFRNPSSKEAQVSVGMQCYECKESSPTRIKDFVTSQDIRDKLAKITHIGNTIGQMMMLTSKTKGVVAGFTMNTQITEARLYVMTCLEGLVIVLVSVYQVWSINRLLKRRGPML